MAGWAFFSLVIFFTPCPNGNFPHGKFRSLSPRKASCNRVALPNPNYKYKVHAGSFQGSVIHLTLTCTAGSLTCVSGHSSACIYTQGLGTPTASQNNIFDSEKLFVWSRWGSNLRSSDLESDTSNWATLSPLLAFFGTAQLNVLKKHKGHLKPSANYATGAHTVTWHAFYLLAGYSHVMCCGCATKSVGHSSAFFSFFFMSPSPPTPISFSKKSKKMKHFAQAKIQTNNQHMHAHTHTHRNKNI